MLPKSHLLTLTYLHTLCKRLCVAGGCLLEGYGTGRDQGSVTAQPHRAARLLGRGRNAQGRAGSGERRPVCRNTGWLQLGSALPAQSDGASSAPTPMCVGRRHPSCKPHLPPGRCRPQGDEEQVARDCSEPAVLHHNPVFSNTEQHDRRCFNPRGSSLRLGIGANVSQPSSESTLYFGNWWIPSVAPMVL